MTITTKLLFALILALAALTPAVAADISAREADVTIIGQIESGEFFVPGRTRESIGPPPRI